MSGPHLAHRPERHDCCPMATHLRRRRFAGAWVWFFSMGGMVVPISFCPWCSLKLPERRERKLEIVRGEQR